MVVVFHCRGYILRWNVARYRQPRKGVSSAVQWVRVDFDKFCWEGRSLGELENAPPAVESQNSGKCRLQVRLQKFEDILIRIYCCCGAVTLRLGHCTGTRTI